MTVANVCVISICYCTIFRLVTNTSHALGELPVATQSRLVTVERRTYFKMVLPQNALHEVGGAYLKDTENLYGVRDENIETVNKKGDVWTESVFFTFSSKEVEIQSRNEFHRRSSGELLRKRQKLNQNKTWYPLITVKNRLMVVPLRRFPADITKLPKQWHLL